MVLLYKSCLIMKFFTLLSVIMATFVSISSHADVPSWKKGLLCGGYRNTTSGGVTYNSSKYDILIGSAKMNSNTSNRSAILFQNHTDGANAIAHTEQACVIKNDLLICTVDGVSVTIDTNSESAQSSDSFEAKFYHPLLIVSRLGKCRVKETADSDIEYYRKN